MVRSIRKIFRIMLVFTAFVLTFSSFTTEAGAKSKKLYLNAKKLTVYVDEEISLVLVDKNEVPDNTANSNATWTSSDESIVMVEKDGYFWAVAKGKAVLSAYYEGKEYTCKVTVKKKKSQKSSKNTGSIFDVLTDEMIMLLKEMGMSDEDIERLPELMAEIPYEKLDDNIKMMLSYVGIDEDTYNKYAGVETEKGTEDKKDDSGSSSGNKKTISDYTGAKYMYKGKTGYIVLEYAGKDLNRFLKFDASGDLEWNCDWPMDKLKGSDKKVTINDKTYKFDYAMSYPMDWYPEEYSNDAVYLRITEKSFKLYMVSYRNGKFSINTQTYKRVDTYSSKQ